MPSYDRYRSLNPRNGGSNRPVTAQAGKAVEKVESCHADLKVEGLKPMVEVMEADRSDDGDRQAEGEYDEYLGGATRSFASIEGRHLVIGERIS